MNIRDKLLQMVEDGLVDPHMLILAFVKYFSHDELYEFMRINDISLEEIDEYDEYFEYTGDDEADEEPDDDPFYLDEEE
jgi:hypothetical protein